MSLTPEQVAQLREAFTAFDADNSGKLDRNELRRMARELFDEENVSEADLDEAISAADVDGDGQVSFDEFIRVMTQE